VKEIESNDVAEIDYGAFEEIEENNDNEKKTMQMIKT
tara:strand:- start:165 stop:275 length:111 start_codon:yes stop_codon:yes gene_type:complete